jgi:CRISPR-associated exonuclease Cas4
LLILSLLLFGLALVLFWLARRKKNASGVPGGRIIYSDTGGWQPVEKALYDPETGLTGRPDYLVEHKGLVIPVEVKSGHVSHAPHDSHIFQLAAYCWLVERTYGKRPSHGILHYPNRTFAIDYTRALESELRQMLDEMHAREKKKDIPRSHEQPARCRGCGYQNMCTQRLGDA